MDKPISELLSKEAILEQCAEECVELAHACLKMARKLRGENHTPKTEDEIYNELVEEIGDVLLSSHVVVEALEIPHEAIDSMYMTKENRWLKRINENN